jgi:hypothetical protein
VVASTHNAHSPGNLWIRAVFSWRFCANIMAVSRSALAATAVTLATLVATASAAAAPTVTLDRPCYSHLPTKGSQPIVAQITGGTPNADFLLSAEAPGQAAGSSGSASGTFDAAGNATAEITDIFPPSGTIDPDRGEALEIDIQDFGAGTPATPAASTLVTTIAISVANKPTSPHRKRRVRVSAGNVFAGQTLYGFVTKLHSKHVLRRFRVGKANVCGFASTRAIVAPRDFRTGKYRLWINAGRKLNRKLALGFAFRIFRF